MDWMKMDQLKTDRLKMDLIQAIWALRFEVNVSIFEHKQNRNLNYPNSSGTFIAMRFLPSKIKETKLDWIIPDLTTLCDMNFHTRSFTYSKKIATWWSQVKVEVNCNNKIIIIKSGLCRIIYYFSSLNRQDSLLEGVRVPMPFSRWDHWFTWRSSQRPDKNEKNRPILVRHFHRKRFFTSQGKSGKCRKKTTSWRKTNRTKKSRQNIDSVTDN